MRLARLVRRVGPGLALAGALTFVPSAGAGVYYVDVNTGVDDAARDGLSPLTAWKTLTYAVSHVPVPGPHEIMAAPGDKLSLR